MPRSLLLELRVEELSAVPHAIGRDAHGQLGEQRAGPVQQSRLHERRQHGDVALRLGLAVVERADAVPDLEADVPEEGQEAADRVVHRVRSAGDEHEQIDVGLRVQLAAAVTADCHEVGRVEHLLGEMHPARENDLVDDLGAARDERLDRVVAAEALAEPIVRGFERVAERLDGSDVAAQRLLQRAAVDQRRRRWLGAAHRRQAARSAELKVKTSNPVGVTSTVCSHCADREWSLVTTVQPSDRSFTSRLPALTIGSTVIVMPGTSSTPVPGRP